MGICVDLLNQQTTNLTGLRGQDQRPRIKLGQPRMSLETVNKHERHMCQNLTTNNELYLEISVYSPFIFQEKMKTNKKKTHLKATNKC